MNSGDAPRMPHRVRRPGVASDYLPRPRLARRLAAAARTPITLVCAPAGFGKTSLVAHWAGEADVPVAWLTLDPQDGDAGVFSRHVVDAMRAVEPSAGQETARLLRKRRPVGAMDFASALLVDLGSVDLDLAMVLDDYSALASSPVHEVVDEIVRGLLQPAILFTVRRISAPVRSRCDSRS